eukprot:scaffold301092_cov35-Prasinocladus_malaysianus.AAC.2
MIYAIGPVHALFRRAAAGIDPEGELDSAAAVVLARELAGQHPALVLLHVPALIGHLQQGAASVNSATSEAARAVLKTLARVLGLLEDLRTEIQRQCDCPEVIPDCITSPSAGLGNGSTVLS